MGNLVVIGGGGGKGDGELVKGCEGAVEHEWEEVVSKAKSFSHWNNKFKKAYKEYITTPKLKWGLSAMDGALPLYGKKLVFVMARSKLGKTSFMANMVRSNLKAGKKVLIFSAEESGEHFTSRLSNCNFWHPISKKMVEDNYLLIDDSRICTSQILAECRIHKPDIVYCDQFGKMRLPLGTASDKHSRSVEVSESLQGLVKKLGVPLVVAHQINRQGSEHKGLLNQSHVSDCDSVFNEANIALFIQSDDFMQWDNHGKLDDPNRSIFEYVVNISKNRSFNSFEGCISAYFDRNTSCFIDKSPHLLEEYNKKKREWMESREQKEKERKVS